jgi:diguanylate cyclase (GGDEF)-like protein
MRYLLILSMMLVSCRLWAADAERFDAMLRQLDQGELIFVDRASVEQFAEKLQRYLPPNDAKRQLRLQRELCSINFQDDPIAGIEFATKFIQQQGIAKNPLELSHFYLCRAGHYSNSNQLTAQEADLVEAVELARRAEDKLTLAGALSAKADMDSFHGQYGDSLVSLFEANKLYKAISHRNGIGYTVQNIGTSFRRMGEFEKAIEYLELSEHEFTAPGDRYRLAFLVQQKAFAYGEMGKTVDAKQLLERVRFLYQQLDEPALVTSIDIDLLWIANLEQRYSDSVELASQIMLKLAQLAKLEGGVKVANQALFYLYYAEALSATGQSTDAQRMFLKAETELSALNSPRYMLWLQRSWSTALARQGDYVQAYQRLSAANQLQEQLNHLSKQQRESLLRYQFDSELQTEKTQQLMLENKLSAQQVQTLESAQRWQYIAIGLFVLLALIALFYAISQIQRNRQLHRLAMTDELTQVANRRSILGFAEHVRQQSELSRDPWCILLIDIDYFKQCNDIFGHEAGDLVLTQTAQAMKNLARTSDLLGRTGGEEFLLVLPQTRLEDALVIAERLRAVIAALIFIDYPEVRISVSVGVTQAGRQEDVREVMSRADQALYQAKAAGRNQVVSA